MQVVLNKYNYIISYAVVGGIENSTYVDTNIEDESIFDYQLINGNLRYNPLPKERPLGVKLEYDGNNWIEEATLEEQEEHYKELIIEKNKELLIIQQTGFTDHSLEKEINDLKNKHAEVSHQLALKINSLIKK